MMGSIYKLTQDYTLTRDKTNELIVSVFRNNILFGEDTFFISNGDQSRVHFSNLILTFGTKRVFSLLSQFLGIWVSPKVFEELTSIKIEQQYSISD